MALGTGAGDEGHLGTPAAGAGAPHDALERGLRVVMEASGASAGAVCLLDAGARALALATEVGLSIDGLRVLRRIDAAAGAWSVPLDCVLAGEARVLDRATGAVLPPLVDAADTVGVVACLPVAVEGRGAACVVLVAPQAFDLGALEPAVTALAASLPARRSGETDPDTLARAHAVEVAHLTERLTDVERAWARERALRVEHERRAEAVHGDRQRIGVLESQLRELA